MLAVLLLGAGLAACNTGTDPGDTNTERSDMEYTEEKNNAGTYPDTTENLEKIYEGREGTVIGDSAYNQEGKPEQRSDKDMKQNPKRQ